ncbi:hypothetical protein LVJ77_10290 [Conchiformibius kuhniae]|uniref:Uncharacterized protein n=1 Tax=Conchiformibius kuhniae TaxID=211502 RepID=A0A8T9MTK3_9NEIS|nr:hypothetical protein LVJ77_10290 [Conchiformibius kuhniae]
MKESKFALDYGGSAQDKNAAQYRLFRRGGYYTLTLFYNGSCREVAYAEISTTLTDGGKTYRLQQKLTVQPDLVRYG